MKSSQHVPWMQVALAACALPTKQPRQLKVKHVRPDLELMILMRQGFRCRESKWWGWVKQQLKLVHVADSWDMMNYACSFTSEQPKTVHLSKTSLLHESSALHSLLANFRDRLDFITPFHWLRHLTLVGLLSCLWRPLRRKQSPFSQKRGTMEQNGANTGPAHNQDWRGIFFNSNMFDRASHFEWFANMDFATLVAISNPKLAWCTLVRTCANLGMIYVKKANSFQPCCSFFCQLLKS